MPSLSKSSRTKCVWSSKMNCLDSRRARSSAMSLSAASASDTSNTGPNTWFMARKAAAKPDADFRK